MIIRALRLRHGRIALPRRCLHTSALRFSSLESTESANAGATERVALPQFAPRAEATIEHTAVIDRSVPLNDPNHPVALDYAFLQHNRKYTSGVGAAIAPHYKPHELLTKPPSPRDITIEALIAAQAHLGHATSLWNPSNARYIFGIRGEHDPIHIISPDATASHLRRACKVVHGVAEKGGLILFVGTRRGQARTVVKAAELARGCHLFSKWIPGSITNGQQILGRCKKRVKNELDEDVTDHYGFEDQLFVKPALKPDLVVCLNPLENYTMLHECGLNNIPTIGIIDTDANPTWVTYPIPANDDSLRAVQFICGVLGRAGREGQEQRLKDARPRNGRSEGFVVFPAVHGLQAPEGEREERRSGIKKVMGSAARMKIKPRDGARWQQIAVQEEPSFPDEFIGADVRQHEEDQALLDEAEKTLYEQEMASAAAADGPKDSPPADRTSGTETLEAEEEIVDTEADEDVDVYASIYEEEVASAAGAAAAADGSNETHPAERASGTDTHEAEELQIDTKGDEESQINTEADDEEEEEEEEEEEFNSYASFYETPAEQQSSAQDISEQDSSSAAPDLSQLDQSLIDENYLPYEDLVDTAAEDAAQFGIHNPEAIAESAMPTSGTTVIEDDLAAVGYEQAEQAESSSARIEEVVEDAKKTSEQREASGEEGAGDMEGKDVNREGRVEVDAAAAVDEAETETETEKEKEKEK